MKILSRHSALPLAATLVLAVSAFAGLDAQTADQDIDLEAIRARAREQSADAQHLAAAARKRAQDMAADAQQSTQAAQANGATYAKAVRAASAEPSKVAFDFDTLVAETATFDGARMGEAPRFIAFASLSMPTAALAQMIADVPRAGGVVVFRGFPQGSAKLFTQSLGKALAGKSASQAVGIDPRLFSAFGIESVPAYIVAASDFDLCDGFDCRTNVPPHDRMSGNVTTEYALQRFADGGGPGAQIARLHLDRLKGETP
jgi:conjugal transfer pilus assembly protein TrbC